MAGVFICIVALFYKIVISDNTIGPGPTRFFGGIAFCVGLILVLIAGAELFTANALVVIPWLEGQVSSLLLLCNRGLVNLGKLTGAIAVAVSLFWVALGNIFGGAVLVAASSWAIFIWGGIPPDDKAALD